MEEKDDIIKIKREQLVDPEIGIFSKKEDGNLYYLISLKADKDSQNLSDRLVLGTCKQGDPHVIKTKYMSLLKAIAENDIDEFNMQARAIEKLGVELSSEYKDLISAMLENDKDKTSEKAEEPEGISIKRKIKMEEIFQTVETPTEKTEESWLDYQALDKMFAPINRKDYEYLPDDTIIEAGKKIEGRINALKTIKTPEDAQKYEKSLVHFMQYGEVQTDKSRIISNYIEKIQELDHNTIIACLKEMEKGSENEDSKLYSIYLKLQENRIIEKVQKYLINLKMREEVTDGRLEEFLQTLEDQKIDVITNGENIELQQVILENIHNEADNLDWYVRYGRKSDFELMKYIKSVEPQNEQEKSEQEQIEQYLKCRIASLGQINKTTKKDMNLRQYIEETNFMTEDDKEKNIYLQEVSKVEIKYLGSKYEGVLDRYYDIENRGILARYEKELKALENKRMQTKDLYTQYEKLSEKGEEKINE